MGWIAALKQGAPAFSNAEEVTVTGGETKFVDLNTPVTFLTQGTGTNFLKFGDPGKEAKGMAKSVVLVGFTSDTVQVGPVDDLSDDGTNLKTVVLNATGESCQWIWSGTKWSLIDVPTIGGVAAGTDLG